MFANLLIPLLASVVTAPGLATLLGGKLAGQFAYLALMSLATCGAALASWNLFEKHRLNLKRFFESPQPWPASVALQAVNAR